MLKCKNWRDRVFVRYFAQSDHKAYLVTVSVADGSGWITAWLGTVMRHIHLLFLSFSVPLPQRPLVSVLTVYHALHASSFSAVFVV